jgi:hypothetical protein
MARELGKVLNKAYIHSMARKRLRRKANPWWSEKVIKLKKLVYRNRSVPVIKRQQIASLEMNNCFYITSHRV